MSKNPEWILDEAKTHLALRVPGEDKSAFYLDAEGVDDLISNLVKARVDMLPPVDVNADPDPGTRLEASVFGRWHVKEIEQMGHKGLVIAILHPGHRWVALALDLDAARRMADTMDQSLKKNGK